MKLLLFILTVHRSYLLIMIKKKHVVIKAIKRFEIYADSETQLYNTKYLPHK